MNVFLNAFGHPVWERLGWSLIHLLWQGVVVAMLLAGLFWVLRHRSANARYVTAYAALLMMPVMLFVTYVLSPGPDRLAERARLEPQGSGLLSKDVNGNQSRPSDSQNMATGRPVNAGEVSSNESPSAKPQVPFVEIKRKPFAKKRTVASDDTETAHVAALPGNAGQSLPNRLRDGIAATIRPTLPWIVAGWFFGLLVLSVWHLRGWVGLRRLRRRGVSPVPNSVREMLHRLCERSTISGRVDVFQSSRVTVPSLLGFLKPVILLPGSVLTGLTPSQLEAVLAHELAHVRRNDYLHNLLQTAIETLLFFHPAVWWISRRIRIERENCCDDLALSITHDRLLYAQSLTRLEEMRQQTATQRPAALTVAASGGSLINRIRRILGKRQTIGSHIRSAAATGLSGLLAVAAALLLMAPGMMSEFSLVSRAAAPEQATPSKPATATPPKSTKGGSPVNGLRLTLTADRAETTMLPNGSNAKPVKLKLTFTNVSKKPIKLNAHQLAFFHLQFEAAGRVPGSIQTLTIELDVAFKPLVAGDFPVIQPGKSWSPNWKSGQLFPGEFAGRGAQIVSYSVRKPGVYKLRYTYDNATRDFPPLAKGMWTGSVASNEFELAVRPPAAAPPSKTVVSNGLNLTASVRRGAFPGQKPNVERRDFIFEFLLKNQRKTPIVVYFCNMNLDCRWKLRNSKGKVVAANASINCYASGFFPIAPGKSKHGIYSLATAIYSCPFQTVPLTAGRHTLDVEVSTIDAKSRPASIERLISLKGLPVEITADEARQVTEFVKELRARASKGRKRSAPKNGGEAKSAAPSLQKADRPALISDSVKSEARTAAVSGDVALLKRLLKAHPILLHADVGAGRTLLYHAATQGPAKVVSYLLSKKAKVNIWDERKVPLLYNVCRSSRSVEIGDLLLEHGALVDTPNPQGQSPLCAAAMRGETKLVNLLLEHDANVDAKFYPGGRRLIHAILARCNGNATGGPDYESVFDTLLAHKPDLSGCLQIAITYNMTGIAERLLKSGANVEEELNEGDRRKPRNFVPGTKSIYLGNRPLHRAAEFDRVEIAKLLLKHGANVDTRNDRRRTSLHTAAELGKTGAVRVLLKAGADFKAVDFDGRTPLDLAVRKNHREVGKLLYQASAQDKEKPGRKARLESIKKAGAEFLAKNKTKKGVVTTKSGMQYKILKAGTGKSPKKTDTVKIRFSGELIDGNTFATNQTRTIRVTDPNNRLMIKGWTEALQLMKVGAKWKLFVPPDLGWGEHSLPSNVGPYAVLLFEIELLEIVKKSKTDKPKAPAGAIVDGLSAQLNNATLRNDNLISLDFVLQNHSDADIVLAERWNSWGAHQWAFRVVDANGAVFILRNPQMAWLRNAFTTFSIPSAKKQVTRCRLDPASYKYQDGTVAIFSAMGLSTNKPPKSWVFPLSITGTFSAQKWNFGAGKKVSSNWAGTIITNTVQIKKTPRPVIHKQINSTEEQGNLRVPLNVRSEKPTERNGNQTKPAVRAIDLRIMQFKRPVPKDIPQISNSIDRISEHDARRWFTADTMTKLRTALDLAKEDLVIVSYTREAGLKHLKQKSKTGSTVVFYAERPVKSFDFAHWITGFYAVPRNVTLRYFAKPDWERGLSARLILRKKSYLLSGDPKSSPTLIDFDIEIENKSNKDVRIEVGAAGCQLRLTLNGPGAINNVGPRIDLLKNRIYSKNPITILANKKRRLSLDALLQQGGAKGIPTVDDLRKGERGYHSWAYWTKSGKYMLNLNFQFISGPQIVNKMPWVETIDFPAVELTVLPPSDLKEPRKK